MHLTHNIDGVEGQKNVNWNMKRCIGIRHQYQKHVHAYGAALHCMALHYLSI